MAKSVVGVDIGTSSLRAVEVAGATKAHPTILRYHEVPLPEGAARAGEVLEPHTVASSLRQLWNAGGFRSKDVVLGMGNQRVLARDLVVPKAPIQQIREALPFHVQELLPVPVADAVLDFYPISEVESENGPAVNGLLVAATKDAVMANISAARIAGLSPVHVDLIPFALTRVYLSLGRSEGTVALVEVGASTTNVVILSDNVPEFVRIIPVGGDALTAALATRLEVAAEEAEGTKRRLGIVAGPVSREDQAAMEVVYTVTRDLITSIRNTLTYYTSSRPNRVIDRIVLSGGGARLGGFADALGELTRMPIVITEPLGGVSVAKSVGAKSEDLAQSMSVALGLAIGTAA